MDFQLNFENYFGSSATNMLDTKQIVKKSPCFYNRIQIYIDLHFHQFFENIQLTILGLFEDKAKRWLSQICV